MHKWQHWAVVQQSSLASSDAGSHAWVRPCPRDAEIADNTHRCERAHMRVCRKSGMIASQAAKLQMHNGYRSLCHIHISCNCWQLDWGVKWVRRSPLSDYTNDCDVDNHNNRTIPHMLLANLACSLGPKSCGTCCMKKIMYVVH